MHTLDKKDVQKKDKAKGVDDGVKNLKMKPAKKPKYKLSKHTNFDMDESSILGSIFKDKIAAEEKTIVQEQSLQLIESLIDTLEANQKKLHAIMDNEESPQHDKVESYLFDVCEALWAYQTEYGVKGLTHMEKSTGFNIDNWTNQWFAKPPVLTSSEELVQDSREIYDQIVSQYEEQ